MTTVKFKSEISIELDQLLTGVAQLDTPDLEQLLIQIQQVLAHRKNAIANYHVRRTSRLTEAD
ncbi:MAG: hypothetical protein WCQ26_01510 [Pseudanabaena sp. ELA748]